MSPNAVFQYRDTALEAAYLEIGRLQNTNTLQRQLLDAATTRISDLAQYQGKAANIIARLKGQNPCLKEARAAWTSSCEGRWRIYSGRFWQTPEVTNPTTK